MANISATGVGEVLKGNQHVCKVQYRLQQKDTLSGSVEISGEVTVDQTERLATEVLNTFGSGQLLTLRLENNRQLDVSFNAKDAIAGVWKVVTGPGNSPLD